MSDEILETEKTLQFEPNEFGIVANAYTTLQMAVLMQGASYEHTLERAIVDQAPELPPLLPARVEWEVGIDPTIAHRFIVHVEAVFPGQTFELNGNTPAELKALGKNQILRKVQAHTGEKQPLPKNELWYVTSKGNKMYYVRSRTPVEEVH